MIFDVIQLIKKNFKVIFRSKSSIFTLILAPVLIIYLLGLAFNNTTTYNINIGIYSSKYSELANNVISQRLNILLAAHFIVQLGLAGGLPHLYF